MENQVLFTETQRFKQWWLLTLLLIMNCIGFWTLIQKYFYRQQLARTAQHDYAGAEVVILFTLLITVFFLILKLETIIKTDEIEVRFYPFHKTFRHYSINTIDFVYVRTYEPLEEFGGWGMRIDLFGKGEAVNLFGKHGIQLIFNNKSKLLIGTQQPEEVTVALSRFELKKDR